MNYRSKTKKAPTRQGVVTRQDALRPANRVSRPKGVITDRDAKRLKNNGVRIQNGKYSTFE
ncbi:hypothetical protein [uncultured Mediterranean phage uvMED]|nr:hypothetical protein [uncultured Mediterranean phage uvMED]BAQ90308.1 hypothetical protein [uncultured Mediterranean phage uvMED]